MKTRAFATFALLASTTMLALFGVGETTVSVAHDEHTTAPAEFVSALPLASTVTPTPQPTKLETELVTFSDPDFGFTFLYPASLTYQKWEPTSDILAAISLYSSAGQDKEHPPEIAITVFDNPERLSVVDWGQRHSISDFHLAADLARSAALFEGAGEMEMLLIDNRQAVLFPQTSSGLTAGRLLIEDGARITSISYTDSSVGAMKYEFTIIVASLNSVSSLGIPTISEQIRDQVNGIISSYPSPSAKTYSPSDPATLLATGYRLPWVNGVSHMVTQGWGGSYSHTCPGQMCYAYDFDMDEGEEVRASHGGTVSDATGHYTACGGYDFRNLANRVTINHDDGTATLYLHLSQVDVADDSPVNQGARIGLAGATGWTQCNPHLHFQRQAQGIWITDSRSIYFDEYQNQELMVGSSYTSQNSACPQSGGVILYKDNAFGCGGVGEGNGYVFQNKPGGLEVPATFNDQTSSIKVPSGWSVRLYEHYRYSGGSVCRSGDDSSFTGDAFNNGVPLDNQVSSFWVFDLPNCQTFTDVPADHLYYKEIEALYAAGYVAGCNISPRQFCPDNLLTRAEAAVFILRGVHGAGWEPAEPDVQIFVDVPPGPWYYKWVIALWEEGYTAGCGTNPLRFCPLQVHTRAEAAVFFLRIKNGGGYNNPPAPTGIFADVPLATWYAKWVEAAYKAGLIPACATNPLRFCPDDPMTRGLAAYSMVRAKGVPVLGAQAADLAIGANSGVSLMSDASRSTQLSSRVPTLRYSTYLGGSADDVGNAVAVDGAGNMYVTGHTDSSDFAFGYDVPPNHGNRDAFVAKLDASGSEPLYITYLGGSGLDEGHAIAVDDAGNAYVVGYTDSSDLTTQNPFQATLGGERDVFVAKLDASGAVVYSTYLGGTGSEEGYSVVVDDAGNAYVAGRTYSTDFPLSGNPLQSANAGGFDAFVTKLNAAGSLVYSTYLGGSGSDVARGLAVASGGNVVVVGDTSSTDFPMQSALQGTNHGGQDVFVAKLDANGSQLIFSTYLGGSEGDWGRGVALDSAGNAYITGDTASADFPLENPLQNAYAGGSFDAFVTKLNATASALVYSTYLGGSGGDAGHGIVVDGGGPAYIAGHTGSVDFPTAGARSTAHAGSFDIFAAKLAADGSQLLYNLYLGGSAGDVGNAISMDRQGSVYVTGYTLSPNLPTAKPLLAAIAWGRDAFVIKIREEYPVYLPLIAK